MRPSPILVSTLAVTPCLVVAGFGDVTNCALPCVADVSGSNCTASNWTCLCANGTWVEQIFNPCVVKSCNQTAQETTFQAFAQICNIFNIPLTASAEATFPASALSANASSSLSAALGPGPVSVTSVPAVTSAASTMETSTTPTSNSASNNAGGIPASSTGTASATSTPSAGNIGASTSEQNAWFVLAVLLLAGAAIL